jgi:hypothetical protein
MALKRSSIPLIAFLIAWRSAFFPSAEAGLILQLFKLLRVFAERLPYTEHVTPQLGQIALPSLQDWKDEILYFRQDGLLRAYSRE